MYPDTSFNAHPAEMPQCLADDPPIRSPPVFLGFVYLGRTPWKVLFCNTLAASWNMMKHVCMTILKYIEVRILPYSSPDFWFLMVFSCVFLTFCPANFGCRSTEELLCGLTIRKSLRSGGRGWMTMPKDVASGQGGAEDVVFQCFDFRNRCRKWLKVYLYYLYSIAPVRWFFGILQFAAQPSIGQKAAGHEPCASGNG